MELQTQTQIVKHFNPIDLTRFTSIQAQGESTDLSPRYSFIPTTRVIDVFKDHGFYPVLASEVAARKDGHVGFQKHLIRFRQKEISLMLNECFPEITLTNSHDGLASFMLLPSLLRLACLNGLITSAGDLDKLTIRHKGYTDEKVSMAINYLMAFLPMLSGKIREFKEIDMSPNEQGVFVQAALTVRYDQETLQTKQFDTAEIIRPLRSEDRTANLWSTYNIVQEKMIKGRGIHSVNRAELERSNQTAPNRYGYRPHVKSTKSRGINAISENVRVNQALWLLTEKMAELKKGHGQMSEMVAA